MRAISITFLLPSLFLFLALVTSIPIAQFAPIPNAQPGVNAPPVLQAAYGPVCAFRCDAIYNACVSTAAAEEKDPVTGRVGRW